MQYETQHKKGSFAFAQEAAVMTLILILSVALVAILLEEFRGTTTVTTAHNITNETYTALIDHTPEAFTNIPVTSLDEMYNSTTGTLIPATSYTFNSTHFTITNDSLNHTNMDVSYIYTTIDATLATNITDKGLEAAETYGNFLPVIAIVSIIVVILSLVTMIYMKRRGRQA